MMLRSARAGRLANLRRRPCPDQVAQALLLFGTELPLGVETRPTSLHDAAQRRALDLPNHIGHVVEQPLRDAPPANRDAPAANPEKEKLVRSHDRERQRDRSHDERESDQEAHVVGRPV